MILDENGVLEPVSGQARNRCEIEECEDHASWKTPPRGGGDPVFMCGWHVLYGGSQWGHERRDEIVGVGRMSRAYALKHRRKSTHVPELDPRGRLNAEVSDRFLLGVKYASELILRSPFGRLAKRRVRQPEVPTVQEPHR